MTKQIFDSYIIVYTKTTTFNDIEKVLNDMKEFYVSCILRDDYVLLCSAIMYIEDSGTIEKLRRVVDRLDTNDIDKVTALIRYIDFYNFITHTVYRKASIRKLTSDLDAHIIRIMYVMMDGSNYKTNKIKFLTDISYNVILVKLTYLMKLATPMIERVDKLDAYHLTNAGIDYIKYAIDIDNGDDMVLGLNRDDILTVLSTMENKPWQIKN